MQNMQYTRIQDEQIKMTTLDKVKQTNKNKTVNYYLSFFLLTGVKES